jgi:hypothetical protein
MHANRASSKEQHVMIQLLTLISVLLAIALGVWIVVLAARLRREEDAVAVQLRLDRSGPGSHLMWDIANVGGDPITVTKLVISSRMGPQIVPLAIAHVLETQEHTLVPTDVDWTLLSATSMAVCDADGREHRVPRRQLKLIQEQLERLIERRVYCASARDWLYGATNLAFGMVILGLGFFMLMWVIATG